jgi:hypothetical protein
MAWLTSARLDRGLGSSWKPPAPLHLTRDYRALFRHRAEAEGR